MPEVRRTLQSRKGGARDSYRFFLERIALDSEGFLLLKAGGDGRDPYEPDADDGTVPALVGKWYEAERIAGWLKQRCEKGGRIVLHSVEADGQAWGWEFDGQGRMRDLVLKPVGKWR